MFCPGLAIEISATGYRFSFTHGKLARIDVVLLLDDLLDFHGRRHIVLSQRNETERPSGGHLPYSSANGLKIYYEVYGEGFPFLFVHATPFDHNLFLYQISHFSTYFKVVALDMRGFGRSDKPTEKFTLDDMAEDVLGVCRDEEIQEAILLGASVGSGIALLLGLNHPEMFKALILVGGNSGGGAWVPEMVRGYTEIGVETYRLEQLTKLLTPEFMKSRIGAYLIRCALETNVWLSAASIAQVFCALGGTDLTPRLQEMKVPTLVINGEHDASLEPGRRTAEKTPGATHKILLNTSHACCIEDPAGFDALVIDFLRAHKLMPTVTE